MALPDIDTEPRTPSTQDWPEEGVIPPTNIWDVALAVVDQVIAPVSWGLLGALVGYLATR